MVLTISRSLIRWEQFFPSRELLSPISSKKFDSCLTAKRLNLAWSSRHDIGPSLAKSLVADVPIMNVERELVVRLEDQNQMTNENDLRDMASFITALPLADVFVAEKPFVNLARQARLGDQYHTVLLTSVTELIGYMP